MFDNIKTEPLDQVYDGSIHHLNVYTNHCYNEDAPFGTYDQANIEITHNKHDINLINQNFLSVTARVGLDISVAMGKERTFNAATKAEDITTDANEGTDTALDGSDIWIGWKNSGEIITEMQVYNRGKETGYHNINQDRDNYIENTKYKTKTYKEIHPECHLNYYDVNTSPVDVASPGFRIRAADYNKHKVRDELISYTVEYPIVNNEVIIINANLRTALDGVADGTDFQELSDANMKMLLYLLAEGTYKYPDDVRFHFAVKKNAADTHYIDVNDNEYDTEALAYAAWVDDSTLVPQFDGARVNTKHEYVTKRHYGIRPGYKYYVDIPLIIPLKDFACFASMSQFERIFGDITLRLMCGPRSMVYYQIDNTNHVQTLPTQVGLQTGDWGTVDVVDFQITHLACDCFGYNISPSLMEQTMMELTNDVRIYQARYNTFRNFDSQMIGGKYDMDFPYPLYGVKDIHIVFPHTPKSRTVFRNPILKDMQLKIDGTLYPKNEALRTDDKRFYYMQIMNTDADDSLKYSYSCKQLDNNGAAVADTSKVIDDTNFIATWNLMVGQFHVYDPIGEDNVNIHFNAAIGHDSANYYGRTGGNYNDNLPSPQIWFTSDAGWMLNYNDGLQFVRNVSFMNDLNSSKLFYI